MKFCHMCTSARDILPKGEIKSNLTNSQKIRGQEIENPSKSSVTFLERPNRKQATIILGKVTSKNYHPRKRLRYS